MDKKLLTVVGILGGLVLLYFINLGVQNSYSSDTTKFFSITEDSVSKIVISSNQDAIELIKNDTTWAISGNDTLTIKENVIGNLFDRMSSLEQHHLVTSKEENWDTYNVSSKKGTHLAFINHEGNTAAYYVFGTSATEYNRCYVRMNQDSQVFLLNNNIIYQLQTTPTFWGEVPVFSENDKIENTN